MNDLTKMDMDMDILYVGRVRARYRSYSRSLVCDVPVVQWCFSFPFLMNRECGMKFEC